MLLVLRRLREVFFRSHAWWLCRTHRCMIGIIAVVFIGHHRSLVRSRVLRRIPKGIRDRFESSGGHLLRGWGWITGSGMREWLTSIGRIISIVRLIGMRRQRLDV